MKLSIVTVFLLISSVQLNAQFFEQGRMYITTELAGGNYLGADLNLNYVFKNKYSWKLGYSGFLRKAVDQPSDFELDLVSKLFLAYPLDKMSSYQLMFGKVIRHSFYEKIRLNVSLGVGYSTIWKTVFEKINISNSLEMEYDFFHVKDNVVSLILNPKIEFRLTGFYGLTISPLLHINKGNRNFYGLGVGQMFGDLGKL